MKMKGSWPPSFLSSKDSTLHQHSQVVFEEWVIPVLVDRTGLAGSGGGGGKGKGGKSSRRRKGRGARALAFPLNDKEADEDDEALDGSWEGPELVEEDEEDEEEEDAEENEDGSGGGGGGGEWVFGMGVVV